VAALLLMTLGTRIAEATTILSPVAVPVNTLGEWGLCCEIGSMLDQSGLDVGFKSGVTDFDHYQSLGPLHDPMFDEQEFFGESNTRSGTIVLDLGAPFPVDRMALWNEDSTGIKKMTVETSDDQDFLIDVTPQGTFRLDRPTRDADYPAQLFDFDSPTVRDRYVKIEIRCYATDLNNCGIGEVAFSVPEPTSALLFGLGLAGLAAGRRRLRTG
jgi:hypothetical protein